MFDRVRKKKNGSVVSSFSDAIDDTFIAIRIVCQSPEGAFRKLAEPTELLKLLLCEGERNIKSKGLGLHPRENAVREEVFVQRRLLLRRRQHVSGESIGKPARFLLVFAPKRRGS